MSLTPKKPSMTLKSMIFPMLASLALGGAMMSPLCAEPVQEPQLELLDAIDVWLTPEALKRASLTPELVEPIARDASQRRYRRVRAMGALTLLSPERAFALLPQLLAHDSDREVRIQAAILLARTFGERAKPTLLKALSNTQDEGVRSLLSKELEGISAR